MTSESEPMTIQQQPIELEQGLRILRIDRYSGIFLEDGTDEMVTDVLMVILENTAEQDLQLARITLDYGDQKAEFEVTDLPAGECVVALERSRMAFVEEELRAASAQNIVFFQERMDLAENRIKLEGKTGMIRITNQSGEDLPGPVCIYYKNRHDELYYGGFASSTARAVLPEAVGPAMQMMLFIGLTPPYLVRILNSADREHILCQEAILRPGVHLPQQLDGFSTPGQGQGFQDFVLGRSYLGESIIVEMGQGFQE